MRKLAPARVSYRDDFFISYRVYIMTGSLNILKFEGILHVDKITNITHGYLFQSTGRPISQHNGWLFHVYMILLQDFVLE